MKCTHDAVLVLFELALDFAHVSIVNANRMIHRTTF